MGNSFALALRLLTILPDMMAGRPNRADARRAVLFFPIIGLLIGLVNAGFWALASRIWSHQSLVAAALIVAVSVLITGGRSLGGVARMGDGLAAHGSGGDRSRAFAIMRDPRRGTMGLVALCVSLVLRLAFLSALPEPTALAGLVLAATLGRWATAFAFSAFPLASAAGVDSEISHGLSDAGPNEFLAATVLVIVGTALLPKIGFFTLMTVAVFVGGTAASVNRTLGGFNPPMAAALGELGEIVALACFAIR